MAIREVVTSPSAVDEISEVLGEKVYASRYYWKELRDIALGRFSRDLVGVSRFYLTMKPPIVVDFEPTPPEKFHLEVKRKFFMEKGIVYVPILLGKSMSKEQFAVLVKEERDILTRGYREVLQDQALLSKRDLKSELFNDPEVLTWIHAECLRRAKDKKLKGAAMTKHLPHLKEQIITELRPLDKDAILGRIRSGDSVSESNR